MNLRSLRDWVLTLLLGWLVCQPGDSHAQTNTISTLGPPPDNALFTSRAIWINNKGEILASGVFGPYSYGTSLYLPSPAYGYPAGLSSLYYYAGSNLVGRVLNGAGQIGGEVNTPTGPHIARWQFSQLTDYGTLGGSQCQLAGINDLGTMAGSSSRNGSGNQAPFLVVPGATNLTLLPGFPTNAVGSASFINSRRQIIGSYGLINSSNQILSGFQYFFWENGQMRDLSQVIGFNNEQIDTNHSVGVASVESLNDLGDIAGLIGESITTNFQTTTTYTQFLFLHRPAFGFGPGFHRFPMLGIAQPNFQTLTMNNTGLLIYSVTPGGHSGDPRFDYLRDGTNSTQLEKLLPANSGWTNLAAASINDAGQIVGQGRLGGKLQAFLFTPAPPLEIIVNSTGDEPDASLTDGVPDVNTNMPGLQITLRCAIDFANRHPGKDIIKFDIKPEGNEFDGGVPIIRPMTELPHLTDSVRIDGWSQKPESDSPPVELSGELIVRPDYWYGPLGCGDPGFGFVSRLLEWPGAVSGLHIEAPNCEICGLVVVRFPLSGLLVESSSAAIQGNYLGISPGGDIPRANGFGGHGICGVRGAQLLLKGANCIVGGTTPHERNLISGLSGAVDYYSVGGTNIIQSDVVIGPVGILIAGNSASGNAIEGNFIGLDPSGSRIPFGPMDSANNNGLGPIIQACGIVVLDASNNRIGSKSPGGGNILGGNQIEIIITGSASENVVLGNRIGTDAAGLKDFHPQEGISLGGHNNQVGGREPGAGNIIMGGDGITQHGYGNQILGNKIGIGSDGPSVGRGIVLYSTLPVIIDSNWISCDLYGVFIWDSDGNQILNNTFFRCGISGVRIDTGSSNLIRSNLFQENGFFLHPRDSDPSGVAIKYGGSANTISQNSFVNSARLGIGLGDKVGPLPNDSDDSDVGPNGLLNYPTLSDRPGECILSGTILTAQGVYNGRFGGGQYRLEFFASRRASSLGFGEGERFLGALDLVTGLSGYLEFTYTATVTAVAGEFVTATATDSEGNTSEFSKAVQISSGTDTDHDGICDELETAGPSGGDANGDGIPDANQPNVTSFTSITGKRLTLAVKNGLAFQNVIPTGPPDFASLPVGYDFPYGFVSLTVTGLTAGATVTLTNLHQDAVGLTTVFTYGPTTSNPQPHWYELNSTISSNAVWFTLTDGGAGDQDLSTNGVVTTIYSLAYLLPPVPRLSLLSFTASPIADITVNESGTNVIVVTNALTLVRCALAWPATATNYVIESTESLSPVNWLRLRDEAVIIGDKLVVTNFSRAPARFYRLRPGFVSLAQASAPTLNIQLTSTNKFLLSWPSSFIGFALQQNSDLFQGSWTSMTNPVNLINNQNQVIIPPATGSRYFRLKSQ